MLEEAPRGCGTHLVPVQEQAGDAHVSVLEGVHEGRDPTAVPAVGAVLAPARQGHRAGTQLPPAPKPSCKDTPASWETKWNV